MNHQLIDTIIFPERTVIDRATFTQKMCDAIQFSPRAYFIVKEAIGTALTFGPDGFQRRYDYFTRIVTDLLELHCDDFNNVENLLTYRNLTDLDHRAINELARQMIQENRHNWVFHAFISAIMAASQNDDSACNIFLNEVFCDFSLNSEG